MSTSAAVSTRSVPDIPVFKQTDYIIWTIDADGRFETAFGAGMGVARLDTQGVIGLTAQEIHPTRPDIAEPYNRILCGETVSVLVELHGVDWHIIGEPRFKKGRVTGGAGVSFALEAEAPKPDPCGDFDVYASAGDLSRLQVWSDDRWWVPLDEDCVYQIRRRPRRDWEEVRNAAPDRMHAIRLAPRPLRPLRLL